MQVALVEGVFSLSAGSCVVTVVVCCIGRIDCCLVIWLLGAVGLFGVCRSFLGLR